jgi:hypothetical protein
MCSSVFASIWVEWLVLNSADTLAILLDCESHVAALTPARSPGVLHDPEVLSVLTSVANDESGVIKVGTTGCLDENSTCVLLEYHLVSFD